MIEKPVLSRAGFLFFHIAVLTKVMCKPDKGIQRMMPGGLAYTITYFKY